MQSALATFGDGVLVIECPRCWESGEARVDNLISRFGGQHKMAEVVARLRWWVPRCGAAPSMVRLKTRLHQVVHVGLGAYG